MEIEVLASTKIINYPRIAAALQMPLSGAIKDLPGFENLEGLNTAATSRLS
jgi:hypothetical protein